MWHEYLGGLFASIGGQLAALLAGIVAVLGGIFYHRTKVNRAEDKGRDDGAAIERDRVERERKEITEYMEQRKREVKEDIERDTDDRDSLRDRMRDGSSDRTQP